MRSSIFYALTEAEVRDPDLLRGGLEDVAAAGFDAVYLEYRNTHARFFSERFQHAVRRFFEEAERAGLRVIIDLAIGKAIPYVADETPELFVDAWQPVFVDVVDHEATVALPGDFLHHGFDGFWSLTGRVGWTVAGCERLGEPEITETITDGGGCAMTRESGRATCRVTLRFADLAAGSVMALRRDRFQYVYVDWGRPEITDWIDRMVDSAADLPVAGAFWDEPHHGFAFWPDGGRAISDALLADYERRTGGALIDVAPDLWFDVAGRDSGATRLAFNEMLEDRLFGKEQYFRDRALETWPGIEIGTHRTMHEELSDDFIIGCADYFRHNAALTSGYTDSVFEREDSMVTMLQMTRSLAAAYDLPNAWNNSWGFVPTEAHHAFYLPLMGAMGVRWLGHAYRHSHQFGPGYPQHPLWKTLPEHLALSVEVAERLDGCTMAADTAIVYNWRALASFAGPAIHLHRRELMLLTHQLTLGNVPVRFVRPEDLAGDGMSEYRRVIVPWADRLPAGALATLGRLGEAGVDVIFTGPPARFDADGADVAGEFAELVGGTARECAWVDAGEVTEIDGAGRKLDPVALTPTYHNNPANTFPEGFPRWEVAAAEGAEVIARAEGACVRRAAGRGAVLRFPPRAPRGCAAVADRRGGGGGRGFRLGRDLAPARGRAGLRGGAAGGFDGVDERHDRG